MVGSASTSNSSHATSTVGLVAAPVPGVNTFARLTAKVRLPAALRSSDPPPEDGLLPLYVEAITAGTVDAAARLRLCRAITHADGNARRYVAAWIPYYIEAVCSYSDDPQCVLFVLALIHQRIIDVNADFPFSEGVYSAALYYPQWEGLAYRVAWGVPPFNELRRSLAALYLSEPETFAPERTALVEAVYTDLGERLNAEAFEGERNQLANYLARAYRAEGRSDSFLTSAATAARERRFAATSFVGDDPHDDPEAILRGGSGNPDDDVRIARRYVEENRPLDGAACTLFARCVRHAETDGDKEGARYWTVKLAHALIAVNRVDEDTRDILEEAVEVDPSDPVLELAFLYGFAKDGSADIIAAADGDAGRRLEMVVREKADTYKPIAQRLRWDWSVFERALALAWGHRGRTDAVARALYKQVVDKNPDDRLLAILYARALAQANVTDRSSIVAYERAVEWGKATDAIRRSLAAAYAKNGAVSQPEKRSTAIRLLEEMYRSGMDNDPDILSALADAYADGEEASDVAIAIWEKTVRTDPRNARIRLRLAQEMEARGDLAEAARLLKEAAKLQPEDFEIQYETGRILHARNEDVAAVRYLRKATALRAGLNHRDAHFVLGETLLSTEKRDEAREVFEKITQKIDPDHAPTMLHLAKLNLRYDQEGVQKAEALYEKALALDDKDPDAYKRLAMLHEEQGRFADAEAALEKYLELSAPDADTTRRLADLYLKRGDFIRAESALRQTVALGGGDKKLFGLLGEIIVQAQMQRDGQTAEARAIIGEEIKQTLPAGKVDTTDVDTASSSSKEKRQTLVTQSSMSAGASGVTTNTESPAVQNLTRSVGAAAIKAALRSRAARLTQSLKEDVEDSTDTIS